MPAIRVQTTAPLRDMQGRFTKATKGLLEKRRDAVRNLGRRWVEIARQEAPKNTGDFAKGISFRSFIKGDAVGFRGYTPQPLGKWIIEGTKPHRIEPIKARALYFYWPKVGMDAIVPMRGGFRTHEAGGLLWIGKGYVDHPGTKPNPFTDRATDKWYVEVEKELARISKSFVWEFGGKS